MTKKAAIILAGGRGERFQGQQEKWQDKALVTLFGKPLIVHAVESVEAVVEEIVICVNEEKRKSQYAKVLKGYGVGNVKLVLDEKCDHLGGPLVGIFSGLESVDADFCFTLPGDMPLMKPNVIKYMFEKAKDALVVVPIWPNGRLETLSMVLEKPGALDIAQTLCMLGRPRSDDLIRGALNVTFVSTVGEIASLDPELRSFININSREDLVRLQPRRVEGTIKENLHIKRGTLPTMELELLREASLLSRKNKLLEAAEVFSSSSVRLKNESSLFWAAISCENEGKSFINLSHQLTESKSASEQAVKGKKALLKAAAIYDLEAQMHQESRCIFLAERARSDEAWCEAHANRQT